MALLSGQIENGWEKSTTTSNLVKWEYNLTHTSSTSSNQVTSLIPSEVVKHIFKEFSNVHVSVNWGSGAKTTTFNLVLTPPDDLTGTTIMSGEIIWGPFKKITMSSPTDGDVHVLCYYG